ncbi:efflux transporter outer membrane subunit [Agrobacterium sp. MOPV5]|uniref:efflux transporter outer membrane subunit n=1 Tax=Agrobacterium leguminum TaxID=2792015 RepID=UPI0018C1E8DD|nr:efflux transporter outer membrane subunit [Agrobacterium leguminum]MBG0511640.1 efflux transporter outer membrane subunit [Agrobacterium leguminum]
MPAKFLIHTSSPLRVRFVATILSTSLLAGCVVGPDYERPNLLMPAQWSGNAGKTAARPAELSQWWTRFNDPVLTSLVTQAIDNNRSVEAAKARVREARASLRQETANLLPTGNGSASLNRARTAAGETVGPATSTTYQSGLDASWEIDLFGGKRRAIESARYGVNVAEEDLRNTMLVLIGDVALNYAQARAYQARTALARRTGKSQRESAVLTRAKQQAGTANVADVANAEALAATTEADIPSFEISAAQAIHRLSVLTGQPPSALTQILRRGGRIPRPKLPLTVGIPADVLRTRPDVRMAEFQLAQATARVGSAEAARYPSVSLTGNIATQALDISDLGRMSTIAWAVGPSVTVPIFRAGQLKAAADAARARRDESFAAWQSSVLTAMEDVENAIVSLSQQRVRGGKLSTAVTSYRTAADASRAQFEAGASGYLELLDAQRALYAAESNLIDNQLAVVTAYIALNKALGGGWTGVVDT